MSTKQAHWIDIDSIKYKTPQRIREIRKKYRRLKFTCHDDGAGGSERNPNYQFYDAVVRECDRLERSL